jgi:hypothetical protein
MSTPTARLNVARERLDWMAGYLDQMLRDLAALDGDERQQAANTMAAFLESTVIPRVNTEGDAAGRPETLLRALADLIDALLTDANAIIEHDPSRRPFESLLNGVHVGWRRATEAVLKELKNSAGVVDWDRVAAARIDIDAVTDKQLVVAILNRIGGMTPAEIALLIGISTTPVVSLLDRAFLPGPPLVLRRRTFITIEVIDELAEVADAMTNTAGSPYWRVERNAKHLTDPDDPRLSAPPNSPDSAE